MSRPRNYLARIADGPEACQPMSEAWPVTPLPEAWPVTPLPEAEAIIAVNDQFIAVGSDDAFPPRALGWLSTDGLTWQPATVTQAPDGSQMTALTATPSGFVAVGTETSPGSGGPDRVAAWTSVDGLTWEPASVSKAARKGLGVGVRGVADGPGGLLALATFVGQDAGPFRLYQSLDGQAWQPVDLPTSKNVDWSSFVAIPDGYLLIGNTFKGKPATFRSADGVTWKKVTDAPRLLDAATGADGTIVGIGQHRIWVTQDLVDWEGVWRSPDVDAITEEYAILWVTWDGSQFAVAGVDYEACVEGVDECQRP